MISIVFWDGVSVALRVLTCSMSLSTQVASPAESLDAGWSRPCRLVVGLPTLAPGALGEWLDATSFVPIQTCEPKWSEVVFQLTSLTFVPIHWPIVIVPGVGVTCVWVPEAVTASVVSSSWTQLSGCRRWNT